MLSLIAIIYGAIVALVQPDLKRLVAYSSVSHMGFVTLGLFVFTEQGVQGAILQMINHGLITGGLFLLVGVIYERTHDRTIAKMSRPGRPRVPVYAAVFGFFVFASAGLPGLSGFVGEFLTLVGTFEVNVWAAAIATVVMVLAAGYLLYMYGRLVFGEVSDFLKGLGDHLTDMTPVEILTLVPLATLIVVFGIQPGLLLDLVKVTVDDLLLRRRGRIRPSRSDRRSSSPASALVVVLVLARIGWVLARGGESGGAPAAAAGDRAGPPTDGRRRRPHRAAHRGRPDRRGDPRRRPHLAGPLADRHRDRAHRAGRDRARDRQRRRRRPGLRVRRTPTRSTR